MRYEIYLYENDLSLYSWLNKVYNQVPSIIKAISVTAKVAHVDDVRFNKSNRPPLVMLGPFNGYIFSAIDKYRN